MIVYGIDPGTKKSALAMLTIEHGELVKIEMAWEDNVVIKDIILWGQGNVLSIEWVQNYGRVVGEEVLRTAYWCGAFANVMISQGSDVVEYTRPQIVRHFTGQTNVKKAHVRQALLDRFGGSVAKRKGGILYGISNHKWDALAVAMYLLEDTDVCTPDTWSKGRSSS